MDPKYFESQYPADSMSVEISKTLSFIQTGASCQVLGLPGVGKSVMLRLLAYNKKVREVHLGEDQKKYHFVYMDFLEVKNRSLLDVTKFILISLSYSLNERGMQEEHDFVNDALKDAISFQDELILFQALKKSIDYLATERGLTVVLLLDRFDQYTQDVTDQFFANLKILRNRAKYQFSCVFSLPRPLDILVDPLTLAEYYEFVVGNTVFFGIQQNVVQNFRMDYIEQLVKKKDEKLCADAIELTNGHAKLLKISYEALLVTDRTLDNVKNHLLSLRQVQGALYEIWSYLLAQEKILLKNLITQKKIEDSSELSYLTYVGLVNDSSITIPLFEEFIRSFDDSPEEIIYDQDRNEILKGDSDITDQFTPSEFRMLRYLILNKGKVCEKDELIEAVWKDTATREGVTDQALDQIVYRLRKKIENDPNNPTLIQTVKGRGIKYS